MSALGAQLSSAWIKGARRKLGIKPTELKHKYEYTPVFKHSTSVGTASAHLVPKAARVFKIGDDAIVVTDGTGGYMPFCLSALRKILSEVEAGPTVREFRCDR